MATLIELILSHPALSEIHIQRPLPAMAAVGGAVVRDQAGEVGFGEPAARPISNPAGAAFLFHVEGLVGGGDARALAGDDERQDARRRAGRSSGRRAAGCAPRPRSCRAGRCARRDRACPAQALLRIAVEAAGGRHALRRSFCRTFEHVAPDQRASLKAVSNRARSSSLILRLIGCAPRQAWAAARTCGPPASSRPQALPRARRSRRRCRRASRP